MAFDFKEKKMDDCWSMRLVVRFQRVILTTEGRKDPQRGSLPQRRGSFVADASQDDTPHRYRIEQPTTLINILAGSKKVCDISQGLPLIEGGVGHGSRVMGHWFLSNNP